MLKLTDILERFGGPLDRAEAILTACQLDSEGFDSEASYDGPGRFEGNYDRPLAVALDIIDGHGFADDHTGEANFGYASRFGRFILWGDSQGFLTAEAFETESEAIAAIEELDARYGELDEF